MTGRSVAGAAVGAEVGLDGGRWTGAEDLAWAGAGKDGTGVPTTSSVAVPVGRDAAP